MVEGGEARHPLVGEKSRNFETVRGPARCQGMRPEDGHAFSFASCASVEETCDAVLRRRLVSALADTYNDLPSEPLPPRMKDLLDRLGELWGDSQQQASPAG